jgi:hypothetical protein
VFISFFEYRCDIDLSQNNDKDIQTDLIIMDFAKAFDKVPHKRLLYKTKYFGISEQIINWVKSFLSNRTQTVGVTFAWFQSDGTLPVSNDLVNNNVKMSVHISISFSVLCLRWCQDQ